MSVKIYSAHSQELGEFDPAYWKGEGFGLTKVVLASDHEALQRENDFLRAQTGNSAKSCVYCGLGADEQAKCERGFPGCARADDQMLCREVGVALERDELRARVATLTANLDSMVEHYIDLAKSEDHGKFDPEEDTRVRAARACLAAGKPTPHSHEGEEPVVVATLCVGCGQEIDETTCHCGEPMSHGPHDNHDPIPAGCNCFRYKGDGLGIDRTLL